MRTAKLPISLCLCWPLLSAVTAQAQTPTPAPVPPRQALAAPAGQVVLTTTVPLTILPSRHLAVPVKINGKGPFRLVLDTGSPITFLSNRAARASGLIDAKTAGEPALLGLRGQTTVKRFAVGTLPLQNFDVMILDHPVISLLSQVEGPLDGIVGFSFFSRCQTTIDYAGKHVTFKPGSYKPTDITMQVVGRLLRGQEDRNVVTAAGLWGLSVDKAQSDTLPGITITRVYAGGAADAAGLEPGDRLLLIDGRWADSVLDCYDAASLAKPGQPVTLTVRRDDREQEITLNPHKGI